MTLTPVAGRRRNPREVHADRRRDVAAARVERCAGRVGELRAHRPRCRRGDRQRHRRVAALDGVEHSLRRCALQEQPATSQRPDGTRQISATGPDYRGPGAPASGPAHHYVFELFALDTTLDVPAVGASPPQTRAAVVAAMAGTSAARRSTSGSSSASRRTFRSADPGFDFDVVQAFARPDGVCPGFSRHLL